MAMWSTYSDEKRWAEVCAAADEARKAASMRELAPRVDYGRRCDVCGMRVYDHYRDAHMRAHAGLSW